mgnify:CR=1 FL=1
MRKSKPLILFCPNRILDVINMNVETKKENYIYIIHYILKQPLYDKRYNEDKYNSFAPVNKEKTSSLFGCNCDKYIKFLRKYELIEDDKKCIPNKKAYYYRINPKYTSDLKCFELQTDTTLFNNKLNSIKRERSNYSKLEPHLYKMVNLFMSFEFDTEKAIKWINTIEDEKKRNSYLIAINQIYDKRLRYFKRNKTNKRLDTNLTNINKELRQFIIGNFVSIDLKNSQPFLLIVLLEKIKIIVDYFYKKDLKINDKTIKQILNKKGIPLCSNNDLTYLIKYFGLQCFKSLLIIRKKYNFLFFTNLSNYKKSVIKGNFYNEFISAFDNISRDEVKEIMFEVLFSQNTVTINYNTFKPFKKDKEIFASKYPVIYDIIEALKANKYNKSNR